VRAVTGIDARLEGATAAGLHPGKTARIMAGETHVGFVGTLDPRLLRAHELTDDAVAAVLFIDALPAHVVPRYRPLSKFPALERDLAVIVDAALPAVEIEATIAATTPLARSVDVFDEYRGPQIGAGKKSLAVRIVLQHDDGTLTDADAETVMAQIVGALREAHAAVPRG
jgi:phenylalanyl-tRNA synthetase beta chain